MTDRIFSAVDKVKCAERELRQRKRVYPRLIEGGRMTRTEAERETALMESIAADYRAQVVGECLPLFPKKEARRVG
ncbi:hypothetical protein [Methylobacterium brachythecii]|uniref:Uncharacterized protein n=1 Tax=Methylobacterium brachythecii TaxID=1176177 RepID=A0A7W6ANK0_9HYPH|nr:hypothetical protein [Methylobacterium brachythecii]MBB3905079.1 hypothetical protein [Methylobacterium brachythecii]GLS44413.1 hypothetical protein GCM10007884_24010 [Methylobacterium brachythecii]